MILNFREVSIVWSLRILSHVVRSLFLSVLWSVCELHPGFWLIRAEMSKGTVRSKVREGFALRLG